MPLIGWVGLASAAPAWIDVAGSDNARRAVMELGGGEPVAPPLLWHVDGARWSTGADDPRCAGGSIVPTAEICRPVRIAAPDWAGEAPGSVAVSTLVDRVTNPDDLGHYAQWARQELAVSAPEAVVPLAERLLFAEATAGEDGALAAWRAWGLGCDRLSSVFESGRLMEACEAQAPATLSPLAIDVRGRWWVDGRDGDGLDSVPTGRHLFQVALGESIEASWLDVDGARTTVTVPDDDLGPRLLVTPQADDLDAKIEAALGSELRYLTIDQMAWGRRGQVWEPLALPDPTIARRGRFAIGAGGAALVGGLVGIGVSHPGWRSIQYSAADAGHADWDTVMVPLRRRYWIELVGEGAGWVLAGVGVLAIGDGVYVAGVRAPSWRRKNERLLSDP